MRTALLALTLFAATSLTAGGSYLSALPAGKIKVDVMTAVTSPRAAELTAKLQDAVERNREQTLEDVQNVNTEERLASLDRLGLSREERKDLEQLRGELTLVKTGEAMIEFVRTQDGRVVIVPDASLPELAGVSIDVTHDAIDTPFGRTTERADMTSNADPRAEGAWHGTQWTLDAQGEEFGTGTNVKLAIGQLASDGRIVLKYDAKQIETGKAPRRASTMIVLPR